MTLYNVFDAITASEYTEENQEPDMVKAYAENGMGLTLTNAEALAISRKIKEYLKRDWQGANEYHERFKEPLDIEVNHAKD